MTTYTPSANEIEISGLPKFLSGGQNWAGVQVYVPLQVSDPSQFYVKDLNGNLLKVDLATAAQLYATTVAIRDLNYLYGPGRADEYPAWQWQPVLDQVRTDALNENLLNMIEGFGELVPTLLPMASGLAVPGVDVFAAAGIIQSVLSTTLSVAEASYTTNVELGLATSYLRDASRILTNAEKEYSRYIFGYMTVPGSGITSNPDEPIEYNTVYETYYNTILSIDVGQAASKELGTLVGSTTDDLLHLARSAFNMVASFVGGKIWPDQEAALVDQMVGTGELIYDVATSKTPAEFAASLQSVVNAAESAAKTSSPFTAANIAAFQNKLVNSVAVTQGQVLGSTPSGRPVVSAKSTGAITVDGHLSLTSLFTPSITPSGTSDALDHFTLVNLSPGSGKFVINGIVHTEAQVFNVTQAMLKTAYFTSSQAGTDQIKLIAYDTAGNSSGATTTITVSAASSPPPASTASNLKVISASLALSSLTAGGGGTVAFSVKNQSASAAPNTAQSQLYLSTNATLDSSDLLISPGSISDAGLAAGATQAEQLPFTLPSNSAGSFYLIAFAGDPNQVSNGGAAGNTYAIPVTIAATSPAPQVTITSPSAPSGANPLSIVTNTGVTTRVGSEPGISSSALRAVDSQYSNGSSLRYTIVTAPSHGVLIDRFFTTSTFTQADIDNGLVDYVQDGSSVSSDSFSFYVSDPAGYKTTVQTFTINILPSITPPPPVTPNVTLRLANDTGIPLFGSPIAFNTSDATLTGTANAGATVSLLDGSNSLGTAVADANGNWTFSPSGLSQGGHYITASVTISGQTAYNYLSFGYDTVAPPAASTPALALGGSVATSATPTFSGTSEASDEILLLEGNSIVGSGMATPGGTWTIATSVALTPGYHTISTQAIDPAGNLGPVSAGVTIQVVTPPPGQVTLNDTAMINAHAMSVVGTIHDSYTGVITEYGSASYGGYQLTNQSRSGFSFVTWNQAWTVTHQVNTDEYYDGQNVLIVPTDGIVAPGVASGFNPVPSAVADTIDLRRADGAAFSLVSIDIGPTGNYPTSAIFTGTTAGGETIVQTIELILAQNSTIQPVALTGFGDVIDVKFTERYSGNGDPTSVQFDNIVVGNPTVPQSPTGAPFTAAMTLDDASIVAAGQVTLKSSDINVGRNMTYRNYGPIAANGFTISNLDRTDFAFTSIDSNFASVNHYFYDGPDVFSVPFGSSGNPSRVLIQRPDGVAFGITSIALDSTFATGDGSTMSVTFTGTTPAGNVVTQTFQLDNAQGLQTFQFNSSFGNLKSLQFAGTAGLLFNSMTLVPTVAPSVAVGSMDNASRGQAIALSSLVAPLDPSSVGFSQLKLWHSVGPADGSRFVVNGAPQTAGHEINVVAADIANTVFNVGSGGTDHLWAALQQNDGTLTPWQDFTVTSPLDNAPVVSAPDFNATHNQSVAATSLFSVTDADGDTITAYQFWDGMADPSSGHWVVGGLAQSAGQAIDVTPAQLAAATFQSGSGPDHLWVRAYDGSMWSGWQGFFVNAPVDQTPIVTATDRSASHNQSFNAASLFSVSDGDGDAITTYGFWDAGAGGGHFVLNGVALGTSQEIDVSAAQLSLVTYQSGSGPDTLWVRANDGTMWGNWSTSFKVTAPIDSVPVVTVSNMTLARGNTNPLASSLFSVSDADSDAITTYAFWDTGNGGGHFVLNGVPQATGREIDVSAAQLAQLTYQSGSAPDTLWVKANDGILWGNWSSAFTVSPPINQVPVVTAADRSAGHNQSFNAASLFSVSDGDGDAITTYGFWDTGAGGGHFVLNGVTQGASQEIDVTAAQLSLLTYQSGSGPDTLWVRANDGIMWGNWSTSFRVTAPLDHAPVATGVNTTLANGSTAAASSLFSVSDADGDTITTYAFWDTGNGGGHFVLNGVPQTANHEIDVSAAQLAQLTYQGGSAADTLWVKANDGMLWGNWSSAFTVSPPSNHAPVVSAANVVTALGETLLASNLFSAVDADHDAITQYDFWNTGAGGGRFVLNGVMQQTNADIVVTAAQLAQLSYQSGSGADTLWVRASDSLQPGNWSAGFTVTAQADSASIKLNDAAMFAAGTLNLVNTFNAANGGGTLSYYGPVTSNGFTLTNINRNDFSLISPDATYAATFGYFYDGAHILEVPAGGSASIDTIRIQAQDSSSFSIQKIDLDTIFATTPAQTATFTGTRSDNSTITQTFTLDNVAGLQTFQFGAGFTNLKSLDFSPSMNEYFDNLTLTHLSNTIAVGAVFEIGSATARAMTFAGSSGTLRLDNSAGFSGTVAGKAGSDAIDFGDVNFASVHAPTFSGTSSSGTLSVTDGTHSAAITLLGNYLSSTFTTSSDGRGGTLVV